MTSLNTNAEELFTKTFFGHFTLPVLYTILTLLFISSIYILYRLEKLRFQQYIRKQNINRPKQESNLLENDSDGLSKYTKPKYTKLLTLTRAFIYGLIISSGFIFYLTFSTHLIAIKHGFTEYKTTTLNEICYSITHSPIEDTLPTNLNDTIIIYYRFGCSDCELLYNKIYNRLNNVNHVYWVATRSEQGIELRKTYPIAEVPTSIYIDTSGEMTEYTLSTKTENNNQTTISLNEENLNALLSNLNK